LQFPEHTVTALVGEAVGDSFGCPFEFHAGAPALSKKSVAEGRYLSCHEDVHQPVRRCRTSGLYSDDTQQALVLLWIWSQVVAKGKDPKKAANVAELFLKICRRMAQEASAGGSFGLHRGTGHNFREAILRGVVPDTAGLGGAMRIGPVATLIDDPKLVMPWAVEVTAATTSNPVGLAGAALVAGHAWTTARDGWGTFNVDALGFDALPADVKDALHLMSKALTVLRLQGEDALLTFASKSGTAGRDLKCAADGFALTGVPWVLHCVDAATSFEDALLRVCASGGDTDTVAAIAGCLAALRFGRAAIPAWMTGGLVGLPHVLDPNLWHPLASERPYVRMDHDLQTSIEAQIHAAARARPGKKPRA
jgi:ADP-ribosylglycohydrolase